MIVTVTPNPSVDRTLSIPSLVRGEVVRATSHRTDAGGKGVNVALAILGHGGKARAVLPSGGAEGLHLESLLREASLDVVCVPVAAPVRANISVVEPDGTVTKINESGPVLTGAEVADLLAAVAETADGASWVVTGGSLPPGAPRDLHARVVALGRAAGARTAVDASGPAFTAALSEHPDLVKPNRDELVEAVGRPLATLGEAADAARELVEAGAVTVLATFGSVGALLVTSDEVLFAAAPRVESRSNVGAGDASLAGYLHAADGGTQAALRSAVAWGVAAVSTTGSRMPPAHDVDLGAVEVRSDIPRATRL